MKKFPDFKQSNIVSINANSGSKNAIVEPRPTFGVKSPPAGNVIDFFKVEGISHQQELLPRDDQVGGDWQRVIGAAMAAWGELTEAELLATNGHAHSLSRLVEKRYATTRDEAETLVRIFFESLDQKFIDGIKW